MELVAPAIRRPGVTPSMPARSRSGVWLDSVAPDPKAWRPRVPHEPVVVKFRPGDSPERPDSQPNNPLPIAPSCLRSQRLRSIPPP